MQGKVIIHEELCKSCGLCAHFCPRGCLITGNTKVNAGGYFVAEVSNPDNCNGCGICGWMCPDYCIEVYKSTAR